MYRRIIVGHDLHDGGDDALVLGRQLAARSEAKLVVAGVFPFGILPHGFEWREEEQRIAVEVERLAEAAGAEPEAIPSSSPARGLHDLAEESGADLIVVGSSRHSSAHQSLTGNVGLGLLHGSPCAVAIAPSGYRQRVADTIRTIAVGFDGSEESSRRPSGRAGTRQRDPCEAEDLGRGRPAPDSLREGRPRARGLG